MHACVGLLSRFSRVQLLGTPWTVAHQAPLSMGFSRPEFWSGLPFPPPGDLPDPGIELESPAFPSLQADSLQLNQLCTHTHTHTHDFFRFFSLIGYYKVFPVLYRRSLLVIYFIYITGSVFMLTLS